MEEIKEAMVEYAIEESIATSVENLGIPRVVAQSFQCILIMMLITR